MENTVIGQENGTVTEAQAEKTFTQAELDKIVKERVAKEKAKYGDYETLKGKAAQLDEMQEANKSELQKATEKMDALQKQVDSMTQANTLRELREKVASETGVPANLLHGETEEDCLEFANQILAFKNSTGYPSVKDGGEPQKIQTKTTADDFADWFNKSLK